VNEKDELRRLRLENAHFKDLLTRHSVPWDVPSTTAPLPTPQETSSGSAYFTTED